MRRPLLVLVLLGSLAAAATPAIVFRADIANVLNREPPLALLGKQAIRNSDFEQYLKDVYPPEKLADLQQDAAARQSALTEYLDALAVAAKGRKLGIDQDVRYKKAVELMEMKILARLLAERHRADIVRNSQVLPDEVKAYYEQHKGELVTEPRFTAHHLLVYVKGNPAFPEKGLSDAAARGRANQALAKLRAGASWEVVAKTYSDEYPTNQQAGLIRDGRFGYFAPELERAIKTQELRVPGSVVKSAFGYHVVQVEDRVTESVPKPFEEVREIFTERLSQQRGAEARKALMTPLWKEIGFELTEAGQRDAALLNEDAVALDEILATVGGRRVLESDFRWFLKDAFAPQQRMSAYSRPGARQGMLGSYLDMLVLEAKARKEGLDRTPEYLRTRRQEEQSLLAEFVQQRDNAAPSGQREQTADEAGLAQRQYLDRVRAEVGLKLTLQRE